MEASITAVLSRTPTRWRGSGRSSLLMETLGGFAIAASLMCGGYRIVAMGATPETVLLLRHRLPAGL